MAAYKSRSGHIGIQEIVSLIALCLALLISISFYLPKEVSGAMGVFWRYLAFGLCGPLYHCVPLLLLLTAWIGFRHKRHSLPKQLIVHCLILYLVLGALLQFFTLDQKAFIQQVEQMTQFYQRTEPNLLFAKSTVRATTSLSILWHASIEPLNFPFLQNVRPVGVIAGTFSLAFHELFGSLVGKIVLIILLAGELRIIFGFSIIEWIIACKDVITSSNANIRQAVHETMQELKAQKAEEEAALAELYKELPAANDSIAESGITAYTQTSDSLELASAKLPRLVMANNEVEQIELTTDEVAVNELEDNKVEPTTSDKVPNKIVNPALAMQKIVTNKMVEIELATSEAETNVPATSQITTTDKLPTEAELVKETATLQTRSTDITDAPEIEAKEKEIVEPQLIDHNAWRKRANKRIWSAVEQANLFNPNFQGVESAWHDTTLSISPSSQQLQAKPILRALDLDLHTSEKTQAKNKLPEHQELTKQAEQAELAALDREYDLLNQSSLQPQFSLVEQEVDVDPFAFDAAAKEIALNSTTHRVAFEELKTDTKANEEITENEEKQVNEKNQESKDIKENSIEEAQLAAVLGANTMSVATKEREHTLTNEKSIELLADLDLTHDKDTLSKADSVQAETRTTQYSKRESKDSLLKASALSNLVKVEAVNKPAYVFPSLNLLTELKNNNNSNNTELIRAQADKLENTLKSFGVEAEVINITTGPTITRFELTPGVGVKVAKIVNLADDIALSLAATGVRIEAPIPGKSAIGIEIPNKEKRVVDLRSLLASNKWQENKRPLKVALGRDIPGQSVIADLADMTHTLIAGATGSGKSICINAILISLLYHCLPEDLKLIMVDPKVVELSVYNGIPHLLAPVVTDPKKAAKALNWACLEMEKRYQLLAKAQVRDIKSYNEYVASHEGLHKSRLDSNGQLVYEVMEHMPYLVVVIDELADLMMTAPQEVEDAINRIAAKGRACGIHLILATQRPSVDVITGVIKANVPSRIAFAVSSQVDSRTILDGSGAEKLLGKGDMLYNPRGAIKPVRGQGAFISDQDVEAVVDFIKTENATYVEDNPVDIFLEKNTSSDANASNNEEQDELFDAAIETILDAGYASVSILQRRLNIGYPRAGRLIDSLEKAGFIGPANGSKPREILLNRAEWENK